MSLPNLYSDRVKKDFAALVEAWLNFVAWFLRRVVAAKAESESESVLCLLVWQRSVLGQQALSPAARKENWKDCRCRDLHSLRLRHSGH